MKCPRCWTEKAYVNPIPGWKGFLLAALLRTPMRCHHCYHKFSVWWFLTLGQQVKPPVKQASPHAQPIGPSYAAQHCAAMRLKAPQATNTTPDTQARP